MWQSRKSISFISTKNQRRWKCFDSNYNLPIERRVVGLLREELVDVGDEHTLVPVVGDVAAVVDNGEQVPQSVPRHFLVLLEVVCQEIVRHLMKTSSYRLISRRDSWCKGKKHRLNTQMLSLSSPNIMKCTLHMDTVTLFKLYEWKGMKITYRHLISL